jgi:hypothetical protein
MTAQNAPETLQSLFIYSNLQLSSHFVSVVLLNISLANCPMADGYPHRQHPLYYFEKRGQYLIAINIGFVSSSIRSLVPSVLLLGTQL